jgi:exosortase
MSRTVNPPGRSFPPGGLIVAAALAALAWAYLPTLAALARRWSWDPQYTHGYVVPVFALIVLWFRRDTFPAARARVSWWGLPLLAAGAACRLAGTYLCHDWIEAGSLLPTLAGLTALLFGPAVLRWAWPAFVFLPFILPLPYQADILLAVPLRRIATVTSTYALQTLGFPAVSEGNVILVDELKVGVVEACSGLGMLMTFFALSTAVAFVVRRPLVDRVVLFLSAVPIGVLMNVVRITVTVILFRTASAEVAKVVFHDVAGWVMMPLALGVMALELWFLAHLWKPVRPVGPVPIPIAPRALSRSRPTPVPATKSRPEQPEGSLLEVRDAAP